MTPDLSDFMRMASKYLFNLSDHEEFKVSLETGEGMAKAALALMSPLMNLYMHKMGCNSELAIEIVGREATRLAKTIEMELEEQKCNS